MKMENRFVVRDKGGGGGSEVSSGCKTVSLEMLMVELFCVLTVVVVM